MVQTKTYKRRPIVEAVEYTGDNFDEIADWCGRIPQTEPGVHWNPGKFQRLHDGTVVLLRTGKGIERVEPGHFIVRNEFDEWEAYDPVQFARLFAELLA